jgi:hypothetical protein
MVGEQTLLLRHFGLAPKTGPGLGGAFFVTQIFHSTFDNSSTKFDERKAEI